MPAHAENHTASLGTVLIREIATSDAQPAAQLSEELGYPVSIDEMKDRIAVIHALPDRAIFVACVDEAVIGWIDIAITCHLATGRHAEICGFVISHAYRSQGVGCKLLAYAERWVAARGIARIVVRSRTTRESAHRFYLRERYTRTKTSAVFSKELNT